ncbi:transposase [Microbacterium sp. CSI-V]|uniref:transposase n=1 Tax=unclassified Microbacterium TaxID=2609290 RepID=UPI00097C9EC4|nr:MULTISPECIES: transposase [unclassified Microbacterium]ONI64538.1 transposase [Microbacterium sp. CSI-V]
MSDAATLLDEVAAELLALPPARFTAARNGRAEEIGGAVGRRIAKLRKPTLAAWAVNLLSRDGQLAEAVELAQALREAQDDADAVEMTRLGRQRRQLVAALARRAADLAAEAGTPLSAPMRDAVEKTVNAAIIDPHAAAMILTGRLVASVDLADDTDPSAAVAGSVPEGAAVVETPTRDDLAQRRARKAAERAVREAERARADADRALAGATARETAAREKADRVRERLEGLRAEIARVEKDADAAHAAIDAAEEETAAARETATARTRDLDHARSVVEGMP